MTEPLKRSRGRPKGSGKDDSTLLAAVADLLLTESIKPTTAMKRVIRQGVQKKTILDTATASTLRRLQEKWGMHHVALSAEAQARLDARKAKEKEERERQQRRSHGGGGYLGAIPQMGSAMEELVSRARAWGISEKDIGAAFPHAGLTGLDSTSAMARAVEAAGLGHLVNGLGGVASRLSSTFPSGLADLAAMNALAKPAQAWETAALQDGAIQSLKRQELAALGMGAVDQVKAIRGAAQVYGEYLAHNRAESQVLGSIRQSWEETREQEAMKKTMPETYDPLTGRYK